MPTLIRLLLLISILLINCQRNWAYSIKATKLCRYNQNTFIESFHNASVVITATVTQLTIHASNSDIKAAKVAIKRVIKGKDIISKVRQILIYGLDHSKVCRSVLYERDTKVILLSVNNGRYYLNPPIVSITLDILELMDSIVRGKPYRKRQHIKQTRCEKKHCPYGSRCVPSSGECVCRTKCHRKGITVCGTNNVSYPSECHLSIRSCKNTKFNKAEIRIKHYGKCKQQNPCADQHCGPGEECVVSEINNVLSGRCQCPDHCDDYGDSVESSPVCASDGTDYKSLCHLQLHACQTQKNITIKFYGKCDPCKHFKCAPGTVCKLNAERKPECRCSEQCSLERNLVCASDGNTYENECLMLVSACRSDTELRVISNGYCTSDNPCVEKRCGIGQKCNIELNGTASCQCIKSCLQVMRPVCGMDGRTYDNECELKRKACENGVENHVQHTGLCGLGVCSDSTLCKPPKICVQRNNEAHCECEECGSQLDQICGSDGITYANPCKMRLKACKTGKEIFRRYKGVCEGCVDVKCEYYSYCVADLRGRGKCECPKECESEDTSMVCATDGITYESECHMRKAACEQQKFIVVSFKGSCDSCINVICPYGQRCHDGLCSCPDSCPESDTYQPVCGEDGVLYQSECHLQLASCLNGASIGIRPLQQCKMTDLTSKYTGCNPDTCSYGGFCVDTEGSGVEKCICDFSCDSKPDAKICASDGVVYDSTCYMDLMSCRQQKPIYVDGPSEVCAHKCECNRVGAYDSTCDADGQCRCRPGVGGKRCDHCVPGFWGIHLIVRGAFGCQPCGCSAFGSSRLDCEQSTGRCQCKNGASGEKCTICDSDSILTPSGCVPKDGYKAPRDCSSTQCLHGAKCVISATDMPDCICPIHCALDHLGMVANMTVCGSDGNTYEDMCELMQFACTHQLDLVPISLGICSLGQDSDGIPMRRERKKERISTPIIGNVCRSSNDCKIPEAVCTKLNEDYEGRCTCKTGLLFSNSSKQCIPAIDIELKTTCKGQDCCTGPSCGKSRDGGRKNNERTVPLFTGKGYMVLNNLRLDVRKVLRVEIWLKALAPDGLVLYWAKTDKNGIFSHGDFVALVIIAHQPHFFWNLGSGVSYVKSSTLLSNHRFSSIRFERILRNGSIQVDGGFTVHQVSLPKNEYLDVYGSDLYIGGVPSKQMLPPFIPEFSLPFEGAIQQVEINGVLYADMYREFQKVGNIAKYEDAPCQKGVCNNGICFAKLNNFTCLCSSNFTGPRCENELSVFDRDPGTYFSGDHEYSYFNRITYGVKGQRSTNFSFWLKTSASEGVIWWENQGTNMKSDYLGLFLKNGRIGYVMNLGNDHKMKPVYMHSKINNNVWHKISFHREEGRVELRVDAESNLFFASKGSTELNSNGVIWIGGRRHLPSQLPTRAMFRGCIKNVLVEAKRLRLREQTLSVNVPGICVA